MKPPENVDGNWHQFIADHGVVGDWPDMQAASIGERILSELDQKNDDVFGGFIREWYDENDVVKPEHQSYLNNWANGLGRAQSTDLTLPYDATSNVEARQRAHETAFAISPSASISAYFNQKRQKAVDWYYCLVEKKVHEGGQAVLLSQIGESAMACASKDSVLFGKIASLTHEISNLRCKQIELEYSCETVWPEDQQLTALVVAAKLGMPKMTELDAIYDRDERAQAIRYAGAGYAVLAEVEARQAISSTLITRLDGLQEPEKYRSHRLLSSYQQISKEGSDLCRNQCSSYTYLQGEVRSFIELRVQQAVRDFERGVDLSDQIANEDEMLRNLFEDEITTKPLPAKDV